MSAAMGTKVKELSGGRGGACMSVGRRCREVVA
jgi:hypothetical protein